MTTPAHYISSVMPIMIAVLLVLLCAAPVAGGAFSYTPNVAWLMALVLVAVNPRAWSPLAAFCVGLLQDILFATPLGAQALLAVLLVMALQQQAARQQNQPFRVRWLEATLVLVVWHALLWLVISAVTDAQPKLQHLLAAGAINALWYPLFYFIAARMASPYPGAVR